MASPTPEPTPTPETSPSPTPDYGEDYTGILEEIRDISQENLQVQQEMRDTQYWLLYIMGAMIAVALIIAFFRGWKGEN